MWYVDKRLSDWNFMTYIQCIAERSKLWHLSHFCYLQIMRTFGRNFYCFLIHIIFKVLFDACDVTTLKIIHPITFWNYTKHPIKVLRNKNNMYMQPFHKTVPRNPSEYFWPNVFNKRNLPQIQDKNIWCLAFNLTKKIVSSKKCS